MVCGLNHSGSQPFKYSTQHKVTSMTTATWKTKHGAYVLYIRLRHLPFLILTGKCF